MLLKIVRMKIKKKEYIFEFLSTKFAIPNQVKNSVLSKQVQLFSDNLLLLLLPGQIDPRGWSGLRPIHFTLADRSCVDLRAASKVHDQWRSFLSLNWSPRNAQIILRIVLSVFVRSNIKSRRKRIMREWKKKKKKENIKSKAMHWN